MRFKAKTNSIKVLKEVINHTNQNQKKSSTSGFDDASKHNLRTEKTTTA